MGLFNENKLKGKHQLVIFAIMLGRFFESIRFRLDLDRFPQQLHLYSTKADTGV